MPVRKRISTEQTVHLKWAPFIFWPVLVVVFLLLIANGAYELAPSLLVGMGIAAFFGVVNHYHTKAIRRNLVDAVYDCGNSLLLCRGGEGGDCSLFEYRQRELHDRAGPHHSAAHYAGKIWR